MHQPSSFGKANCEPVHRDGTNAHYWRLCGCLLAFVACHFLALALAPSQAAAVSFAFLITAPLSAAGACWARAMRDPVKDGWIAAGIAAGLWSAGMAATMVGTLAIKKSNDVDALGVLLLVLYGVPLIYILASSGRERFAVRLLDSGLALTLGVLFFAHTSVFANVTGASLEGQVGLRKMFDIENIFVAMFCLVRFKAEMEPARRSFFFRLSAFSWIYMLVAGYINHFQSETEFGSLIDPILDIPFLLLTLLTTKRLTRVQASSHGYKPLAYFIRAGSPLMLTSTLLAVATTLFHTRPTFALVGFFASSLGTGLRNVLVQSRNFAETDKLDELARIDGLTGLSNRRCFDQVLSDEWSRARRTGGGLAVLMIDIDHFKALNDAYGHQAGDRSLKIVAKTLAACATRITDVVARYGGEEFAVILPATDCAEAAELADRMRSAVARLQLASPTADGIVSVSVGVGFTKNVSSGGPEQLVRAADDALYAAKRAGRNRVMSQPLLSA